VKNTKINQKIAISIKLKSHFHKMKVAINLGQLIEIIF